MGGAEFKDDDDDIFEQHYVIGYIKRLNYSGLSYISIVFEICFNDRQLGKQSLKLEKS